LKAQKSASDDFSYNGKKLANRRFTNLQPAIVADRFNWNRADLKSKQNILLQTAIALVDSTRADVDTLLQGSINRCGQSTATTDGKGTYLLKNLPAGKLEIIAQTIDGKKSGSLTIELTESPEIQHSINVPIMYPPQNSKDSIS
jgi:hypothetical protein